MAFVVDNEIKDRVRSSVDIVDLVGSYVSLRRQGANYVGLCPFHEDRRPSMQVNVARQIWKCWVCDLGGDVFSFLMQKEQLSFPEALAMLAERAGIELPKNGASKLLAPDNKRQLFDTMHWVVEQYQRCLQEPLAEAARAYLEERGLSQESIDRFRIGFAPDSWNYLCDRFTAVGKPLTLLDQVGVLSKNERGKQYDRFRGRVIFPINDAQGRAVSLGGRVLPGADSNSAKYVNCSETRLYQKNQTLYGLDVARNAITKSRTAIVMEGYTDVIMASQFGIPNVVAVCGTALGEGHLRLLQRYCDQVILLLDGDDAGRRRANEILDLFVGYPLDLRVVTLPEELDPCDYLIKFGADALREHISNAVDALEYMIAGLLDGVDPYQDTHRANIALEQTLALLSRSSVKTTLPVDAAKLRQEQMLLRVSRRFGVDIQQLRGRIQTLKERAAQREKARKVFEKPASNAPTAAREIARPVLNRKPPANVNPNDFLNDASLAAGEDFDFGFASSNERLEPSARASVNEVPANKPTKISYRELNAIERELFEILVQREDLVPLALERFDESVLRSGTARALWQVYVECDLRGFNLGFDSVMAAVEDMQIKSLLVSIESEATAKNAKLPLDAKDRLLMLCETLATADIAAEQTRRLQQLQSSNLDDATALELLQQSLQANREHNHKVFRIFEP